MPAGPNAHVLVLGLVSAQCCLNPFRGGQSAESDFVGVCWVWGQAVSLQKNLLQLQLDAVTTNDYDGRTKSVPQRCSGEMGHSSGDLCVSASTVVRHQTSAALGQYYPLDLPSDEGAFEIRPPIRHIFDQLIQEMGPMAPFETSVFDV